jgi:hypothetical protein
MRKAVSLILSTVAFAGCAMVFASGCSGGEDADAAMTKAEIDKELEKVPQGTGDVAMDAPVANPKTGMKGSAK